MRRRLHFHCASRDTQVTQDLAAVSTASWPRPPGRGAVPMISVNGRPVFGLVLGQAFTPSGWEARVRTSECLALARPPGSMPEAPDAPMRSDRTSAPRIRRGPATRGLRRGGRANADEADRHREQRRAQGEQAEPFGVPSVASTPPVTPASAVRRGRPRKPPITAPRSCSPPQHRHQQHREVAYQRSRTPG